MCCMELWSNGCVYRLCINIICTTSDEHAITVQTKTNLSWTDRTKKAWIISESNKPHLNYLSEWLVSDQYVDKTWKNTVTGTNQPRTVHLFSGRFSHCANKAPQFEYSASQLRRTAGSVQACGRWQVLRTRLTSIPFVLMPKEEMPERGSGIYPGMTALTHTV